MTKTTISEGTNSFTTVSTAANVTHNSNASRSASQTQSQSSRPLSLADQIKMRKQLRSRNLEEGKLNMIQSSSKTSKVSANKTETNSAAKPKANSKVPTNVSNVSDKQNAIGKSTQQQQQPSIAMMNPIESPKVLHPPSPLIAHSKKTQKAKNEDSRKNSIEIDHKFSSDNNNNKTVMK